MRRRRGLLSLAALLCVGCQMEPMRRVQPERRRVGLSDVQAAQREVDRTLEQYRRDREAAHREAIKGSDE